MCIGTWNGGLNRISPDGSRCEVFRAGDPGFLEKAHQEFQMAKRTRRSLTIGLHEFQPDQSLEFNVNQADDAMYQGKHQGRNRVFYQGLPDSGT